MPSMCLFAPCVCGIEAEAALQANVCARAVPVTSRFQAQAHRSEALAWAHHTCICCPHCISPKFWSRSAVVQCRGAAATVAVAIVVEPDAATTKRGARAPYRKQLLCRTPSKGASHTSGTPRHRRCNGTSQTQKHPPLDGSLWDFITSLTSNPMHDFAISESCAARTFPRESINIAALALLQ